MNEKQLNAKFAKAHEAAQTLLDLFGESVSLCCTGRGYVNVSVSKETGQECGKLLLGVTGKEPGYYDHFIFKRDEEGKQVKHPSWHKYVQCSVSNATRTTQFNLNWEEPREVDCDGNPTDMLPKGIAA